MIKAPDWILDLPDFSNIPSKDKLYYFIENKRFGTWMDDEGYFTYNPNRTMRFETKELAQEYLDKMLNNDQLIVTEHIFI